MNKAYSRINWENYPSDATPINQYYQRYIKTEEIIPELEKLI